MCLEGALNCGLGSKWFGDKKKEGLPMVQISTNRPDEGMTGPAPDDAKAEEERECVTVKLSEGAYDRTADGLVPETLSKHVILNDPKMAIIPNFISDDEIGHILGLAEEAKAWVPSVVWFGGDLNQRNYYSFVIPSAKTPIIREVEERAAMVANVDVDYVERLVVIRYRAGEFFNLHHDGGSRTQTLFVYLNDVEGGGGETRFPSLGLQIPPIKRSAVLWPNCFPDGSKDLRMMHQGVAPTSGIKYGMNIFIAKNPRSTDTADSDGKGMASWWEKSSLGPRTSRILNLKKLVDANVPADSIDFASGRRSLTLIQVLHDPIFYVIPYFLFPGECQTLINLCNEPEKWKPTSNQIEWESCEYYSLEHHTVAKSIATSLGQLLDVDSEKVEGVRIERYLPGQYSSERQAGTHRQWSVLVYLNDLPDDQDLIATDFRATSFHFRPMMGCALVWHNLLSDGTTDPRTRHSELPIPGVTRHHLTCHVLLEAPEK